MAEYENQRGWHSASEGHRQPDVRNSRHEAARASKLLTLEVGETVTATGFTEVVGAGFGSKAPRFFAAPLRRAMPCPLVARFLTVDFVEVAVKGCSADSDKGAVRNNS